MPNANFEPPPSVPPEPPGGEKPQRLLALDVFRGLTIMAMLLVNNPGSRRDAFESLHHLPWEGCTAADLIFPAFLFIVGTSLAYSLRKQLAAGQADAGIYRRIVQRTLVLAGLGVLLNFGDDFFPYVFGHAGSARLLTLRIPGVLQRIAAVYLITSLVALHLRLAGQFALAAVVLGGYWALLAWLPNPLDYQTNLSPKGNVVRIVDRAVIGDRQLFAQAKSTPTDPEGILSTLPATVNCLMGYWAGILIQRLDRRRAILWLAGLGVACIAAGLAWSASFPLIKKLWTSSYVMLTGGVSLLVLGICLALFDVLLPRRWARPFEIVGVNAIFAYFASQLLAMILSNWPVGDDSARDWLYSHLFTSWIESPQLASLAYAATLLSFWWLILWAMARRGWTFRV
jgi:predicted acyltransferase